MEAFALTGRNYYLYIIYPRVLPWARSFCPFRAYGAYLRNLVNNLKASKMNTLALTFAICLVPATAFLIWLFTPWGKKWSKEL